MRYAQVCSALHQRYADFAPALAASLPQAIAQDGPVKSTNLSRKRAMLRLLAELLAAGILSDTAPLLGEFRSCCSFIAPSAWCDRELHSDYA